MTSQDPLVEVEIAPGAPVLATERLLLGTLEVRLRPGDGA